MSHADGPRKPPCPYSATTCPAQEGLGTWAHPAAGLSLPDQRSTHLEEAHVLMISGLFSEQVVRVGGGEVMFGDKPVPRAGSLEDFSQRSPRTASPKPDSCTQANPPLGGRRPRSPRRPVGPRWHSLWDNPGHHGVLFLLPVAAQTHLGPQGCLTWTTFSPLGGEQTSLSQPTIGKIIIVLLLFAASLGLFLFL